MGEGMACLPQSARCMWTHMFLNMKMTDYLGGIDVRRLHSVVVEHVDLSGGYTYTTSPRETPIFTHTPDLQRRHLSRERTSCATVRSETPAPRRSRVEASMIPSCTEHHQNPGSGRTTSHAVDPSFPVQKALPHALLLCNTPFFVERDNF
jgi:hypothetical protein